MAKEKVLGSRVLSLWMGADGVRWGSRKVEEVYGFGTKYKETISWRILGTLISES